MKKIKNICIYMLILILFCACSNNAVAENEPVRAQDSSAIAIAEEPPLPEISVQEPPIEAVPQEPDLNESDLPPESGGNLEEEEAPPVIAVEGKDYLYDAETGRLSFPNLAFSCVVPPKAMERLAIEMNSWENNGGAYGELDYKIRINGIYLHFMQGDDLYLAFFFLRWPADDWDLPREFGPLPGEVARSRDNEWVILHGPAALAADRDIPTDLRTAFWTDFVDVYEDDIVKSIAFDD